TLLEPQQLQGRPPATNCSCSSESSSPNGVMSSIGVYPPVRVSPVVPYCSFVFIGGSFRWPPTLGASPALGDHDAILRRRAAGHIGRIPEFRRKGETVRYGRFSTRSGERGQTRPWRTANVAAAVRDSTPSLPRMLETWVEAVFGLMKRATAIPRSACPSTRRRRTSTSRSVSPNEAGGFDGGVGSGGGDAGPRPAISRR